MDGSGCQVVQTAATPRNTSLPPPQQHQTMQQQQQHYHHMAPPQLPNLHTSCSSTVAPSHLNVISPLPSDQSVANPLSAQITIAHHELQAILTDSSKRASHIHPTQAMEVKHQYPSAPGGDGSFQNQQNNMNISSNVVPRESGPVQSASQQGGTPAFPQAIVKNEPSSAPVQSHQPPFKIQNEAKEFHQMTQPRALDQQQMSQQHPNLQQMAQAPNTNIIPQQNISMVNLQQHSSVASQSHQLSEQKGIQVMNTMAQAQPNSIPTNVTNASMIMAHPGNNPDQHLQAVRIVPNTSTQQIPGERLPAKVYVPNQNSSGNVVEAHLEMIQQNMKPMHQPTLNTSTSEIQLQQQTSIQMPSGMTSYALNDPSQSIRQTQNQSSGAQLQQPNQTRQYMQPAEYIQQQKLLAAAELSHQQQQPSIGQQQQIIQTGSQASQQPSNVMQAHGVQTHIQYPHQQAVVLQNFQQTNMPTPTQQDLQSQVPQQTVDSAVSHSKPQQYAPLSNQPAGVSNLPHNPQHIQPSAGAVPVKQPLVGGNVAQNSSQQSANNSMPPSRADPNMANYGITSATGGNTSQTTHQQFSGGATQVEKINLVNAQQITVTGAQYVPSNELIATIASTEQRKDNVGEQLMNRLEQISKNQGILQTPVVEGTEGER